MHQRPRRCYSKKSLCVCVQEDRRKKKYKIFQKDRSVPLAITILALSLSNSRSLLFCLSAYKSTARCYQEKTTTQKKEEEKKKKKKNKGRSKTAEEEEEEERGVEEEEPTTATLSI